MITYSACDEDGLEPEGRWSRPKWQTPSSELQKRILKTVGLKYFPDKDIRYWVNKIDKGAQSVGGLCKYPQDWIDECLKYVALERGKGRLIGLKGLVTIVMNEARLQEWKERHAGRPITDYELSRKEWENASAEDDYSGPAA